MSAKIIPMPERVQSDTEMMWWWYCQAAKKAQETQRIEDGIEAGRAWAGWLSLFERSA